MEQPHAPKTLPHSIEAEKSVLGSILLSAEALSLASETLTKDDFYLPAHQDIYDAMLHLQNLNQAVDSVTVIGALESAGTIDTVGGVPYIAELATFTPTAANAAHYIAIVEERSTLRRLIKAGTSIIDDCMSDKPIENTLDDAERRIFDISIKKNADTLLPISEAIFRTYDRIGELANMRGAISGVSTGFTDLDNLTSGMQPGDLVIIAARPAMGKTSFALNLATNAVMRGGKKVAIFSLEMSREQLITRILCAEAEVSMQKVRTGQTDEKDFLRFGEVILPLSEAAIYIDDTSALTVTSLRSKCRKLKARKGLDMVVIDYLQLMESSGNSDSRVQEVSAITRSIKILAKELNVPILLLSQLSRSPDQRKEHRPVMSDLRESGSIEQDADMVMMLYRPSVYGESDDNVAEVILTKNRNGPTETVKLAWLDEFTKFTNLSFRDFD